MKMRSKLVTGFISLAMAAVVALAAGDLFARQGKGPGRGCEGCPGMGMGAGHHGFGHMDRMQKELGLSDEQVKKIFDIGTQYRQKYFENRGNPDKIKALRDEHRKAVDAVFTKEQKDKHDKFMQGRWKDGRGPGKGKGMGPGKGNCCPCGR